MNEGCSVKQLKINLFKDIILGIFQLYSHSQNNGQFFFENKKSKSKKPPSGVKAS